MEQKYRHKLTSVSLVNYHFVWCPGYKRKVLLGAVETRLRELIQEVAQKLDLEILALEIMPDHLHLFVNAPPALSPHNIVARVKGVSSHHLRREFKHIARMPSMWTRSYFVSTAGNVSSIQKYIQTQKKEGNSMARKKKHKEEIPMQRLTATAKVVNLADRDALLLGFSRTKLWNVANRHRRTAWNETGKIPGFAEQYRELKTNRWYKLLPFQGAQEILGEQDDSYRSWFSHRKNGDRLAKLPGFRKKDTLSTITFKQKAFEMLPGKRVKLRLPRTYNRREITLEYQLPPVKLVYDPKTGEWYLHITHKVPVKYRETGNVMALDLGMINIAAGLITDGFSFTVPGGELLALDRYFQREHTRLLSPRPAS